MQLFAGNSDLPRPSTTVLSGNASGERMNRSIVADLTWQIQPAPPIDRTETDWICSEYRWLEVTHYRWFGNILLSDVIPTLCGAAWRFIYIDSRAFPILLPPPPHSGSITLLSDNVVVSTPTVCTLRSPTWCCARSSPPSSKVGVLFLSLSLSLTFLCSGSCVNQPVLRIMFYNLSESYTGLERHFTVCLLFTCYNSRRSWKEISFLCMHDFAISRFSFATT